MDTGVNNDSYAIIELGMVDDINKDKCSRRKMLEQAAGITVIKPVKRSKIKTGCYRAGLPVFEDLLLK
ncbi:MAG: hypothetical protein IPI98_00100 [Chitinophagaceae bacterium]|nr:hypothetical protein [Chitinophagaceae bacterium]